MADAAQLRHLKAKLKDQVWRLDHLYYIVDKHSQRIKFRFNAAQAKLLRQMSERNIILKARQRGFTTFICIYALDQCLFNSDYRAGIVAHDLPSAQGIFRDKVKFPYDNLPEAVRRLVPAISDSMSELLLANNSSLRVATSMRSGTLNFLHVSEFGKLSARFPERAREVMTGSVNTVAAGGLIFIESTAEGQGGRFHDLCADAQSKQRIGAPLSPLDFSFHFYSWQENPEYTLDPDGVVISTEYSDYFEKLNALHGIALSDGQRAWYAKTAETQGDDMKREFPATPEEAFEASIEGAYYSKQIAAAELEGRIGDYPADPRYLVNTAWDIGWSDYTSIWFWQYLAHTSRIRCLAYYEFNQEAAAFYAGKLHEYRDRLQWPMYGDHYFPHDAAVTEWGSGLTRIEQLQKLDIRPRKITAHEVADGINAVRSVFAQCEFDAVECADGLKALRGYRKEWNEEFAMWKDKPLHDANSHGADAMRYAIMGWRANRDTSVVAHIAQEPKRPKLFSVGGPDNGCSVTMNDLWALPKQQSRKRI